MFPETPATGRTARPDEQRSAPAEALFAFLGILALRQRPADERASDYTMRQGEVKPALATFLTPLVQAITERRRAGSV